jgi:hypothetical protein
MVPLLVWHPAIVGCFAAAYLTGGGFDPGRHALVFDPSRDLEPPMSAEQRREYQSRLDLLSRAIEEDDARPETVKWPRLEATAEPELDEAGRPILRLRLGDNPVEVGVTRENIVSESESPEVARQLLLVRLHEELRRSARISPTVVGNDLQLLDELRWSRREKQRLSAANESTSTGPASKLR